MEKIKIKNAKVVQQSYANGIAVDFNPHCVTFPENQIKSVDNLIFY